MENNIKKKKYIHVCVCVCVCVCIYIYDWKLYTRNQHIVNQLYFNKNKFKK